MLMLTVNSAIVVKASYIKNDYSFSSFWIIDENSKKTVFLLLDKLSHNDFIKRSLSGLRERWFKTDKGFLYVSSAYTDNVHVLKC